MNKKIIAVVPLWDDEKQSIWMLPQYMDAICACGGIPIILPLHSSLKDVLIAFDSCDGLLMTGGHDVSPSMYGEKQRAACGSICPARDQMETALYQQALLDDKPVLGICRGLQLINVLEGGTLYQDLPSEFESAIQHHMKPPYSDIAHDVTLKYETPMQMLLDVQRLGVNSYHHQAIRQLGSSLEEMARSEDGLIEAVYRSDKRFVWAVQWHPEFSFATDAASRKIIGAFIRSC